MILFILHFFIDRKIYLMLFVTKHLSPPYIWNRWKLPVRKAWWNFGFYELFVYLSWEKNYYLICQKKRKKILCDNMRENSSSVQCEDKLCFFVVGRNSDKIWNRMSQKKINKIFWINKKRLTNYWPDFFLTHFAGVHFFWWARMGNVSLVCNARVAAT